MRYAVMGMVFAVGLTVVGCPGSLGKLVVVNNSTHSFSTLNAKNLDGDYMVQLVVSDKPETYIQPGETRTFSIAAEGYYSVYASTGSGTWYYGESIYFGPGVTVTWTINDEKDDSRVEYGVTASDSDQAFVSLE